jgi:hypothetical protein
VILGLHNLSDAATHYFKDHVTDDGGAAILWIDAILLVPAIFAVFFYPIPMLISAGVVVAFIALFVALSRRLQRHRTTIGH